MLISSKPAGLILSTGAIAIGVAMAACSSDTADVGDSSHPPANGAAASSSSGQATTDTTASSSSSSSSSGADPGDKDAGEIGMPGNVRALGTVSKVAAGSGNGACPAGSTCKTMTVSCANLPDAEAVVAIRQPEGTAKGTIFVHGGGGGTDFYSLNVTELVQAGFRVAQVRWTTDWENTPKDGIKVAACRPSTVMKWVYDEIHQADTKTGFCLEGHSGGSAVLGYALAHYGAKSYVDYASLLAGPPFARLDYGCAPATYSGPPVALCPELPNAPVALPDKVDGWENTTTCGSANPPAADLAKWAADSVVSPGADYDYPNTPVDFLDCATNPNGTTGGAHFYAQEIKSTHAVGCFTDCQGEALGATGGQAQLTKMIASCKPHP